MSIYTPDRRPRAKKFKTELLLRDVERRSPPHLLRLSKAEWPMDPHDGGLALRVVFEILKGEVMPSREKKHHHDIGQTEAKDTIDVIRAATETIFRPFLNKVGSGDKTGVHPLISSPLEDNLPTLIRWMAFMHRESSLLFAHWGFPRSYTNGPMIVAQSLETIYILGSDKLRAAIRANQEALELVFTSWSWRDTDGRTMQYRFLAEADDRCPAVSTLLLMMADEGCLDRVKKRVHAFTDSENRKFFGAAVSRLEEWQMLRPRSKAIAIIELLRVIHIFLDFPEYAAWYARSKFGPKVLSIARESPDLRTVTMHGPQFVSFPVAISTWLFPMEMMPVVLSYKTVPELLEAGLLEVLADHLLSQSEGTEFPWYPFSGDDVRNGVGEPMPILISLCVHRPILNAVLNAMSKLPQEKLRLLDAHWYCDHWARYLPTLAMYDRAWRGEDQKTESGTHVDLCDNPKHRLNSTQSGPPKECSHCQVTVYCSQKCQHEDWHAFHRKECPRNRYYRLTRQIESSWVGHRYRSFLLSLLHHSVLCYEVGVRAERIEYGVLLEQSTLKYHEKTMGPICEFHKARVHATEDAIVYFNTLNCPTKFHLQSLESLTRLSHDGVVTFHDDRVKFLLHELHKPILQHPDPRSGLHQRHRLALCSAFCGSYRIRVLGLFLVTQDNKEGTTTVQKLNGLVKVERRMNMDAGSEAFVPDCMVPTGASPCDDENCLCRRSFCS